MKKKILLFVKIPPPVTGATIMNQYVVESKLLNKSFDMCSIGISYNNSVNKMGSWRVGKFLRIIKYSFQLIKKLVFFKPDIVYFQISPIGLGFFRDFFYVLLMKISRAKLVYHIRGQGIVKASQNEVLKIMYEFSFRDSDVICLSNMLTYDLESVFSGKIHIVNNGMPDLNPNYKLERKEKVDSPIRLLFFSNLIISKGILIFIDVLIGLKNKGISFNANIVGANGTLLASELEEIIAKKSLAKYVKYLGPKYGNEKKYILENSDVLVFPTLNDAFPGVVIDAMQFGMPVISTYEGAVPDIVDNNVTGFLAPKKDKQQIMDGIIALSNNRQLLQKMGDAGRQKYENKYLFSIFEHNMKEVFDDVIRKL